MTDTTESPAPPAPPPPHGSVGEQDTPQSQDPPEASTGVARLVVLAALVVALGLFAGVSALIVVGAIVVMIFLHELGHFITAKWAGMKVTEFFIGFGPPIWSFTRGETTYGIKPIPAGAYVKIIGMHNMEEVDPADEGRTYRQKSYWRRMSVAVAGSTMHFLIALTGIFILLVGLGVPGGELLPSESDWQVDEVSADSAAEAAGLRTGDRILGADGREFATFADMAEYISARPGEEVLLTVERDGERRETEATIGDTERGGETIGLLGVERGAPDTERVGPLVGLGRTFTGFGEITVESVKAFGGFFTPSGLADFGDQIVTANDAPLTPAEESTGSPASADEEAPSGENRFLSIYGAARLGTQLAETGLAGLLYFLVLINVFIGIFNLVPLLPFDGGHVAIATYERIRELARHQRTRYFADVSKLMPLTYAVILLLAGLFVTTLYLDIINPINLG